jgi:hypothetical protein
LFLTSRSEQFVLSREGGRVLVMSSSVLIFCPHHYSMQHYPAGTTCCTWYRTGKRTLHTVPGYWYIRSIHHTHDGDSIVTTEATSLPLARSPSHMLLYTTTVLLLPYHCQPGTGTPRYNNQPKTSDVLSEDPLWRDSHRINSTATTRRSLTYVFR